MKILIDIEKGYYDAIKSKYDTFTAEMKEWGLDAIRNGIQIPDNITNGEMFCTIFNINDVVRNEYRSRVLYKNYWEIMGFSNIWWDKPYNKKEDGE